jgi:hypothetical protein
MAATGVDSPALVEMPDRVDFVALERFDHTSVYSRRIPRHR